MTAEVTVSIREVGRTFGTVTALEDVSLDIRRGEFFSLLGPSGCGKTTLLRIIGGFEMPSTGEIRIGGRDVTSDPPYRRRSNMVFQQGALFPHLTVAENIAFGLEMKRQERAAIRRRIDEALEMVRLGGFGARRVEQLSGGQRQRVALARALVNEPEVLLLDEPLSALDLQLRLQMQEELRQLQRATGSTFVFVTHDQGEAMAMSDRMAVMSGGRVMQVGTPREIYERPARGFVARFMGHSNFFTGHVAEGGTVAIGALSLPARLPPAAATGQEVLVALRYEKVEVTAPGDGLEGVLEEETYMGPTIRRRIRLSASVTLVSDAPSSAGQPEIAPGAPVSVRWAPDDLTVLVD